LLIYYFVINVQNR